MSSTAGVRSSFAQRFGQMFGQMFGKKTKLTIIGLLAVAVVATATVSIYWIVKSLRKMSITDEVLQRQSHLKAEIPAFTYPYEIKDMSIPLTNRQHTRSAFAQFTLILDCPNEAAQKTLATFLPQMMNTILEVGSNFYVEEFTGKDAEKGFTKFKDDLRIAFSKYLAKDSPRVVVFKDWFVN